MNIFQQITDYVKRQYSTFDMKNNWVGSVNGFGSLNCIYQSIVLPSDTWKLAHNIMVKLPPLISPAFTRIKGIVNSYYCSFASVWNYWNSFISDKPEDVFLSRSLSASYKGKFVEPCCTMAQIALICKVARGYFDFIGSSSRRFKTAYNSNVTSVYVATVHEIGVDSVIKTPTSIVWGYNSDGRRKATLTSNVTSFGATGDVFDYDRSVANDLSLSFPDFGGSSYATAYALGFDTMMSFFLYTCQQVERNLSNHGVPTDLIARTELSFYDTELFNLLPFMCESSIWQNFYRDDQNQSPEFDYREVNGCISHPVHFVPSISSPSYPHGWKLRLLGIPPSISTGSDYWLPVSSPSIAWAVLTGFLLEDTVRSFISNRASATDIIILPKFYNGLLTLKYRNFEKDYFTSASVDPNFGGVSVQVPNTIDALRTASKLEEFLEVSASARDFYNFMKHIWGTNPESTRYSKPLLLGTQVIPIQIGEQLQTSQTTTGANGSPLGERGGVADGYGNSGTVNHYFNEHGIVVSYLSFVLDAQYMQGMPHEFNHHLQLDYPFPQFANLGAESILLKEVYFSNNQAGIALDYTTGDNNAVVDNSSFVKDVVDSSVVPPSSGIGLGLNVNYTSSGSLSNAVVSDSFTSSTAVPNVFGYTPRYSKWKFKLDVVAGQMRDSLEFWHTFRHFSSVPYISNAFVSYMDAGYLSDLNRIFSVTNDNDDKFVIDCFNNGSVRRALPLVPQTTMD